jgi:hypothetical protein
MPTPHKTVDALVKAEADRHLRPVVEAVRSAMREAAPKIEEFVGYSMPMWRGNGHLAFMSSMKGDVKLGFVAGLKLDDKYKLLKGKGKVTRHLIFKTIEDVKPTVLRHYIRQAVKIDAATKPAKPSVKKKAGEKSS